MQAAIELPAQKLGVTLEERLTQRILDDVKQEPGNLPLLEFALTQLWDKQSWVNLSPSPSPPLPNPLLQGEGTGINLLLRGESGSPLPLQGRGVGGVRSVIRGLLTHQAYSEIGGVAKALSNFDKFSVELVQKSDRLDQVLIDKRCSLQFAQCLELQVR